MAVSSANHSGQPAALTCDEAIDQLGDSVAVYLDGGELAGSGGVPSTIVDFTRSDEGEILRVGALSVERASRETLPDVGRPDTGSAGSERSDESADDADEELGRQADRRSPTIDEPTQTARRRRAWSDGPTSAGACALHAFLVA